MSLPKSLLSHSNISADHRADHQLLGKSYSYEDVEKQTWRAAIKHAKGL